MMLMRKNVVVLLLCSALLLNAANLLLANKILPDNIVLLKCSANILQNKIALIYPNPFSESTTIFYTPNANETISIKLYTMQGIFIEELFHETVMEGRLYQFMFNSQTMETGIYNCIIESTGKIISQRIEVVR